MIRLASITPTLYLAVSRPGASHHPRVRHPTPPGERQATLHHDQARGDNKCKLKVFWKIIQDVRSIFEIVLVIKLIKDQFQHIFRYF